MAKKIAVLIVLLLICRSVLGHSTILKSKCRVAEADIRRLSVALDYFEVDNGCYPSTEEGLLASIKCPETTDPSVWQRPYILSSDLIDPWGNKYVYRYPGIKSPDKFELYSLGKDGISKSGGDDLDDINNWNNQRPWVGYYKSYAPIRWYTFIILLGFSAAVAGVIVWYVLKSIFGRRRKEETTK